MKKSEIRKYKIRVGNEEYVGLIAPEGIVINTEDGTTKITYEFITTEVKNFTDGLIASCDGMLYYKPRKFLIYDLNDVSVVR